jgi:hypothetical protein
LKIAPITWNEGINCGNTAAFATPTTPQTNPG